MSSHVDYIHKLIERLQDGIEKAVAEGKLDLVPGLSQEIQRALNQLPPEQRPLWGIKQASNFLTLEVQTLRKMCCNKQIPYLKLNGAVRFDPDALCKWAKAQEIKPNPVWRKRRAA